MRIEIPLANELPLLDVPLSVVVRRLSLPTLLSVFEAILLEKSVVVLSHETSELTPFCLAVLCLIYPFHFQHVFIPLLPPNAHGVLQAPVPYLCGLSPNSLESHSLPAHAIILDVDKDTVDGPEQLPRLPDQERHKLKVKLKELYYNEDKGRGTISYRGFNESVLFHQENRYPLCKDIDRMFAVPVGEIRASFLRFFLSLFRNYKRYLSGEKYRKESMVVDRSDCSEFLSKVLDTSSFEYFIRLRCAPAAPPPPLLCSMLFRPRDEVLFFDDSIEDKKNRSIMRLSKVDTPFLHKSKARPTVRLSRRSFLESLSKHLFLPNEMVPMEFAFSLSSNRPKSVVRREFFSATTAIIVIQQMLKRKRQKNEAAIYLEATCRMAIGRCGWRKERLTASILESLFLRTLLRQSWTDKSRAGQVLLAGLRMLLMRKVWCNVVYSVQRLQACIRRVDARTELNLVKTSAHVVESFLALFLSRNEWSLTRISGKRLSSFAEAYIMFQSLVEKRKACRCLEASFIRVSQQNGWNKIIAATSVLKVSVVALFSRERYLETLKNGRVLTCFVRSGRSRGCFNRLKRAAVMLQGCARGCLARNSYTLRKEAAHFLEGYWLSAAVKRVQIRLRDGAVCVQKWWLLCTRRRRSMSCLPLFNTWYQSKEEEITKLWTLLYCPTSVRASSWNRLFGDNLSLHSLKGRQQTVSLIHREVHFLWQKLKHKADQFPAEQRIAIEKGQWNHPSMHSSSPIFRKCFQIEVVQYRTERRRLLQSMKLRHDGQKKWWLAFCEDLGISRSEKKRKRKLLKSLFSSVDTNRTSARFFVLLFQEKK
mmetsp:Transcript_20703/g.53417  ORF Transcript_20703/g.53417 Transcript_20703/m.53417 type:complete len:819 (+) Transcript_20703:508-2964(+)